MNHKPLQTTVRELLDEIYRHDGHFTVEEIKRRVTEDIIAEHGIAKVSKSISNILQAGKGSVYDNRIIEGDTVWFRISDESDVQEDGSARHAQPVCPDGGRVEHEAALVDSLLEEFAALDRQLELGRQLPIEVDMGTVQRVLMGVADRLPQGVIKMTMFHVSDLLNQLLEAGGVIDIKDRAA